jgi:8-oxo-dGTP pyrophosphatase MutT (NUDIX family)
LLRRLFLPLNPFQDEVRNVLQRVQGSRDPAHPTLASVALILGPDPDSLLLIRRAERFGDHWSGHMALPGGRMEEADEVLLTTAIRETMEEVGLDLPRETLLGQLPDVAPRSRVLTSMLVRPYVFGLSELPDPVPTYEVAFALWARVADLRHGGTRQDVTIEVMGTPRVVPAYLYDDNVVWGMTERVLTSLFELLA